jgi:cation diffusion facilitator family transporter
MREPLEISPASRQAAHEKQWAALTSVIAAVGLTGFKLVIGLRTASLGILAEAAHSGLDLAAAVMTLFAVRISSRPADRSHPYGHGKIENLSALLETFLLLLTCVWIITEAVERLVSKTVAVEVNVWSFLVMVTSIVVDVSRSRVLYRVAKKHNSQALEADALHFSTDVWSSSVVIIGLVSLLLGRHFPQFAWLRSADSIAAILVAVICFYVIYRLGMRTILALLDTAPAGMEQAITSAVEALPGVANCHNVRIRTSGAQTFVDVHVLVDGGQTLQQAHDLTEEIERTIQRVAPGSDVTVHPEPEGPGQAGRA